MLVRELLDILKDHDPDSEMEMAVIAPVEDENEDITVDRYSIEGVMPWTDPEDGRPRVWLVGGDDDDVDAFIDALELEDDEAELPDDRT